MKRRLFLMIGLAAAAGLLLVWAIPTAVQLAGWRVDPANGEVLQRRSEMVAMQTNRGLLRHLLRRWISTGDRIHQDRALAYCDAIAAYAGALPTRFGERGPDAQTRALPAVWEDPATFAADARRMQVSAKRLRAEIVSGGPALRARYVDLHQACAGCHDRFRQPRPRILSRWDRVVDWLDDFKPID